MDIERLDYADPGDRLHAFHAIAAAHPPGPVSSFARFAVVAQSGWVAERSETYLARLDGQVVGGVTVRFPGSENTHIATLPIFLVAAAQRRRGIGSALLDHAADRARADNRTILLAEGTAEAFAQARGFKAVSAQARRLLDLTAVDWAAYRAAGAALDPAYVLDRWQDAAPDDLVDDAAALMSAMNDAPVDDMDIEPARWNAARIRAFEAGWRRGEQIAYTTVARHRATGRAVGLTRLIVDHTRDGWARQTDTAVLRDHRGHGLGLQMKYANTLWFHEREPTTTRIVTWNALTNAPMIAINERMGYTVMDVQTEWQLPL
ncbi:N-acetyltransferase [Acrocarpospora corrugata]|uniref:N-acetyltransferase n=1 Tax=Acrocarpospora corrugata TaxID=35763 RepID=A0A5M3W0U2_9ACTN|nr:GNAT family N-acetyltransferase [Acrocarpospora corrugata]GES01830.1 N-acetyltransferase [Acrocarpospora corrugata]